MTWDIGTLEDQIALRKKLIKEEETITEAVSVEAKDAMIRRMTSELAKCHQESVKLIKLLNNTAMCLKLKKQTNYETIRELKAWVKTQLEVQQLQPKEAVK